MTLYRLITLAYGKGCATSSVNNLLSGTADWIKSDGFDFQASIPRGVPSYTLQQLESGDAAQLQLMLQRMLSERFKLVLHRETREMAVYALTIAKSGTKLRPLETSPSGVFQKIPPDRFTHRMAIRGTTRTFANLLSSSPLIHHLVVDRTALPGEHLVFFGWDNDDDLLDYIEDQLGLRLESAKTPVEILVVDHAEKPSEN